MPLCWISIGLCVKSISHIVGRSISGTTFETGDPKEFINDTTNVCDPPCPFNNPNTTEYIEYAEANPCTYRIRVTEVFTGNYSVSAVPTHMP